MTESGSFKPLTDALVGGFISFLLIPLPFVAVSLDRPPHTIKDTLCQTHMSPSQCIASQVVPSATD